MPSFKNKTIVVTGGTGSLGKVLVRRLLNRRSEAPKKIIVLSRDEAKQHFMRVEYRKARRGADDILCNNFEKLLEFRIGDVRDLHSVAAALANADIVINAAALKQVPSGEYFPFESVLTNVVAAENIVRAIREFRLNVQTVVGISTDKACKPINAMGMTKALQERIFIAANVTLPKTRFICVRYGNVLASRGSVVPLFHEQISAGGPVTITTKEMTRFLVPLEQAVDTICAAVENANPGETYIPKAAAARISDVAKALIGPRNIKIEVTGIRPGEKTHEVLIAEEESWRAYEKGGYYVIKPMLPEIVKAEPKLKPRMREYSSTDYLMSTAETTNFLGKHGLLLEEKTEAELLR